jgi:hypothetical protein
VTIKIGSNATVGQQGGHWITNPSSAGTYTITVGGTFGGSGNMLVAINSGVTVAATVAESLAFTASSVNAVNCTADDGATVNSVTSTATSVPFGTISPNTFYQGCQDLIVSTNAGNGYSVTVQESHAMMTANGLFTIPDTTCDNGSCSTATAAPWVTPTNNGFGLTCFNQAGSDCHASFVNGTKFKPLPNVAAGTAFGVSLVQKKTDATLVHVGSLSSTFGSNNRAGDLIVVAASGYDGGAGLRFITSISDTAGNTYATSVGPVTLPLTNYNSYIFYAKNIASGANTVTVTFNDSSQGGELLLHEYVNADTLAPLDATSSNSASSGTLLDSGSKTTGSTNELIFGYGSEQSTITPGAGFIQEGSTSSSMTEDKNVHSAGSYNATFTQSSSGVWSALMATFKASPAAGQALMASSTASTATGRVKYRLSAGAAQPAGTYTTIISYTIYAAY